MTMTLQDYWKIKNYNPEWITQENPLIKLGLTKNIQCTPDGDLYMEYAPAKAQNWARGGTLPVVEPNLAHINLWYQALKSGQYQQIRGTLHDGFGFCAMGVAYDVYLKHVGMTWEEGVREEQRDRVGFFKGIVSWYRVPELDIWLAISDGSPTRVTTLNDLGRHTFDEIADLIWDQYLAGKDIPEPEPAVEKKGDEGVEDGAPFGAPDGPVQTDWIAASLATMTFTNVPEEWLELLGNTAKELVPA